MHSFFTALQAPVAGDLRVTPSDVADIDRMGALALCRQIAAVSIHSTLPRRSGVILPEMGRVAVGWAAVPRGRVVTLTRAAIREDDAILSHLFTDADGPQMTQVATAVDGDVALGRFYERLPTTPCDGATRDLQAAGSDRNIHPRRPAWPSRWSG